MKEKFDYKDVSLIQIEYLSVFELLKRFKNIKDILITSYKKSSIIESLLLNIPFVDFFLIGYENAKFDACITREFRCQSERLIPIFNDFINDKFKLTNMEFFKNINNKKYSQLSSFLQRKIKEKQIKCFILPYFMEKELIQEIMKRIINIREI